MRSVVPLLLVLCQGVAAAEIPPAYTATARAYGVPVEPYYAIALQESNRTIAGFGNKPWPWTLNIAGRSAYYPTRETAYAALVTALERTERVDVGPMQIHWAAHKKMLRDPWTALDPFFNLRLGAYLFKDCLVRRSSLDDAIGCYHAPNNPDAARRYIRHVRSRLAQLQGATT